MTDDWSTTAPIWERHWARLADPARELIADRAQIGPGMSVLDMGCGTGEFCRLVAERGATAAGIDSSEGMLELAHRKLDGADVRGGDNQALPWADDSFDVVTAFNSFQFATDRDAVFGEAARVARPGGKVAVCVWSAAESCELPAVFRALEALDPDPEPEDDADLPKLGEPGEMERRAATAGLTLVDSGDVDIPFGVADLAELTGALEFDVAMMEMRGKVDDALIDRTIADVAAAHRRDDGSYRFENTFRWIVAEA